MKIWYPNDLARRPLQVSFYVIRYDDGAFTRVHETLLVDHLHELRHLINPATIDSRSAVVFEVSLSMTYRGRELLGPDGAIEVASGIRGPDTRSVDGSPVQVPYGRRLTYQFHAQGDLYHYRYINDRNAVHDLMLPAGETGLEWALMNRRIARIKVELGDLDERVAAENDVEWYGSDGLLAYTFTAPLDQVLTQPRPDHIADRL